VAVAIHPCADVVSSEELETRNLWIYYTDLVFRLEDFQTLGTVAGRGEGGRIAVDVDCKIILDLVFQ